jgi:hypothetical protein
MANEIGLYTLTPPAAALGIFSGDAYANVAGASAGVYTASSGDTFTMGHIYGKFGSGSGTIDVGLYTVVAGVPVTLVTTLTINATTTEGWFDSSSVSVALTGGVSYTLAAGNPVTGGVFSASGISQANGAANDDTTTFANPWVNARFDAHNYYVSGDITAGGGSVAHIPAYLQMLRSNQ